jgi:nucleoside-diphosphate-sugar epimerase
MTLLANDREFLTFALRSVASDLNETHILITGGTGVFGSWLLEALIVAQQSYDLNLSITVLSRNPEQFKTRRPHLACHPLVSVIPGDIRTFDGLQTRFDYIIHAAAESHNTTGSRLDLVDTIVDGTRRILDFAAKSGNLKGMLFVSSNAVYGRAPGGPDYIEETCNTGPLLSDSNVEYDESKRMAEALCSLYFQEWALPVKIARCFPVVGPYLPLDAHFAIGNFIANALSGRPIVVKGDGTAVRSYLYLADLAVWLITILLKGKPGQAYNVGSESAISIADLAEKVAACVKPNLRVDIEGIPKLGAPVSRYVPSITRATRDLGLSDTYGLDQALASTLEYYRTNGIAR